MSTEEAQQIANLINTRNQLTKKIAFKDVLENHKNYVFLKDNITIIACAESKQIQWYQNEISHVSVREDFEGKGIGNKILKMAEEIAKNNTSRIIQCTIRSGNESSVRLFTRKGYTEVNKFFNSKSENWVNIYQKILTLE